jgi:hypothetical protein
LNQVVAIAAGDYHSLALRSSGVVIAWGDNSSGQTTVPTAVTNVLAIAAGSFHSLALLPGGAVTGWGSDLQGQISFQPGLQSVTAVAAGALFSLTLAGQPAASFTMSTPLRNGKNLTFPLPTERGKDYFLQYKNSAGDPAWLWSSALLGNGSQKTFTDSLTNSTQRFYRLRRQ